MASISAFSATSTEVLIFRIHLLYTGSVATSKALIPIITAGGVQFAYVMGGCVVTETVFSWPGVGRQLVDGINQRDLPVVLGFIVMTAIVTCIINLLLDVIYAYVDPRIKAQYAK